MSIIASLPELRSPPRPIRGSRRWLFSTSYLLLPAQRTDSESLKTLLVVVSEIR
jgi:hypothetical protein